MIASLGHRTAQLPDLFRAEVRPTPLGAPRLVRMNTPLARELGLDPEQLASPEGVAQLAGNALVGGSRPTASLYAGHQFGFYVPQLGDGRAILLGELRDPRGRDWELQLKGAGPTPFSRGGDGRAVLRSTIREFLCSEAMHALGIPTTRALSIIGSEDPVYRETVETAAVLCRVAPSHLRFGSFEVLFYRRHFDALATLADHLIEHHFPDLQGVSDRHRRLLVEVVDRTARLVAQWQAVGFAHGVMNTDNMSMLGLTLDYGPFGFLDAFEPGFICNHSDETGRYAFDQQPAVARWNLRCLAQALVPLMSRDEAIDALAGFDQAFIDAYARLMRSKLGLATQADGDDALVDALLTLMASERADYTLTFRALSRFDSSSDARNDGLRDRFVDRERFDAWAARYAARLRGEGSDDAARSRAMDRVNPRYVLRNWIAEQAIRAAADRNDFAELARVHEVLQRPFDEQPEQADLASEPPDWGRHLSVSCSS